MIVFEMIFPSEKVYLKHSRFFWPSSQTSLRFFGSFVTISFLIVHLFLSCDD